MIRIILIDKTCSVHIPISRLGKILVSDHLILQTNQNFFHVIFSLPVGEDVELRGLHSAILLIDTRKVDLRCE